MDDVAVILTKWSIPLGIATTLIGGSTWITTMHNRVDQFGNDLTEFKSDYKAQKDKILDRLKEQDGKLSDANAKLVGLDVKLDLVITAIKGRHNAKKDDD